MGLSGGAEQSRAEGEVEVREERGRVKEGGWEVRWEKWGGSGRRGGGGMTKGDSCDANPTHPLAYIHTHVQALPISVHH